ncbi:interferon-induced protein 44-like [Magallana gigas]|uniref:interferon-induced protein 44-like n=1 Tax=Magallana gigas TaxID=29159 RepID=UPI00333E5638
MDCYLKDRDRLQLSSWLGKECHFKLLYKISRDGGSPQTFHYLCDNKGPTVTIFYNTDNNVYGGYLSESWLSTGGWITDRSSFLFQFYSNSEWKPNKIPLKIRGKNVLFYESNGPTFENLPSFEGNIEKTSNCFEMSTKDLFSGSYYNTGLKNAQSIANGHNNLSDLEVYLVKDGPAEPWREPPIWESETLDCMKEFIRSFQPKEELNVPEVNILLVGQVGAGKSSVVNTINSIWKGEISTRSWAGSSEHSLTTSFTKFRISDPSTGTHLKFQLCDMRGLEETMDVKLEDIAFLLDGNLPNKYKFNPVARATKDTPGFIKDPTMKDMIHTVVFVIDGSNVEVMPDGIIKKLKDIKDMLIDRDVPVLVLVTKIDKVCSDVDKDVEEVYFSNAVKKTVDKVSDVIAIPRSHVLPVKNYEKERTLQNNISILAMEALKQALLFCQDFLENQS